MKVGIIGLGWPGQTHAKHIAEKGRAQVVAVADVNLERAQQHAAALGATPYASTGDMLDREQLDAVLLCTPHFVRTEPIRAIAERGIALFCEKPPAFTLDEARECAAIIRDAGILNSVGFMYRWARITDRAREAVDGARLIACLIRGAWPVLSWQGIPAWLPFKEQSGGPIVEQGVHLIDVARYITGDEVAEVHAFQQNTIIPRSDAITVEDTVMVNLRMASGAVGSHLHNWSHRDWVWEIDLICEDRRVIWDMATNRLTVRRGAETTTWQESDDPYVTEIDGFLDAVAARDQSIVRSSYEDTFGTLAVALAANASFDAGRPETVERI